MTLQLTNNTLESVCRTCLENCATSFNIFNYKRNNIFLTDMLANCTSLEIQKDDGFPINICNDCTEKLISASDFQTMAIESNTKLLELHQHVKIKKEGELCDKDVEYIPINEDALIKVEQTTTDLACKSESTPENQTNKEIIGNQTNIEEIDVQVKLEFESLEENDSCLDDSAGPKQSSEASLKIENCEKVKEAIPVADLQQSKDALGNQPGKGGIDTKARLEFKSLDENGDVSDDFVKATLNVDDPSKTRKREKKVRTTPVTKRKKKQRSNDEKNVELLNNSDVKRIMSSGLTEKQKDGKTVFCTECNKMFSYHYYIRRHAYIHTGNLPYKCDKCEKCYPKEYFLRGHMRSHTRTRDFACDVCGDVFFKKQDLKTHKALKHSEERPYRCKVCDKTYKISQSLTRHVRGHMQKYSKENHTAEKNFLCTTCGKAYTARRYLNNHSKIHHSECDNLYICKYCGKRFLHISSLNIHTVMHTGAQPFACGICSRTFNNRSNVRRHMRIHTGE